MPQGMIKVATTSRMEFVNITGEIDKILQNQSMASGVIHLFSPHTTAGLLINEGADPDVCLDLLLALDHLVPKHIGFKHREGNSPAHIMTMLTGNTLTLFVEKGKLQLGTWQKVFLGEFDGARTRTVRWKMIPDLQQPFAHIPNT